MSMGKHLVILPPLSRTFCSLLGMEFIKCQVLLRQSSEERAGKQSPNTLYENHARFSTATADFTEISGTSSAYIYLLPKIIWKSFLY